MRQKTIGVLAAVLAGLGASHDVAGAGERSLTFNKDIAPLVFANCVVCHRPGEVAPFSLLTYHDVHKHARQMVELTSRHEMPPWKAVGEHGQFKSERRLTDEQISMLKQWVDAGAPEGDPKDLPAAPKFSAVWQMGEPDLIVTMPKAYTLAAEGRDVYRNFVIPVEIPPGKYIRAVEYRPGNRRVVHHAGLSYDTTGKFREMDGKDGAPGFTSVGLGGHLFPGPTGFWVPGKDSQPLPDGSAFAWPKGADFLLQLHLHPSGKPETEQSRVGFYFTNEPPRRSLTGMMFNITPINIPPGEKEYHTRAEKTVGADCDLFGLFPHMHLIGKQVKVTAVFPDGTSRSLLQIDHWDFNWQSYYECANPVFLPKGTRVILENTHDNSEENPANPNHPPRPIVNGEQTTNEMSALLINVIPRPSVARAPATTQPTGAMIQSYLDQAREVVRRFDKDGDGKLSLEELSQIPGAASQDIAGVIKRFDKNGDGKLDAEELARAIEMLQPKVSRKIAT